MRIIRGKFKTRYYKVPKNFPSRPTTDFAKEGLFNILENRIDLEDLEILDLCAGTGNISFEFLSRDAGDVVAVDQNMNCVRHIDKMAREFDCEDQIDVIKSDILKFVDLTDRKFDLIFADPPYLYPDYQKLVQLIFEKNVLNPNGLVIIEHGKETNFKENENFIFERSYGNVHFSFFEYPNSEQ